MRKARKTPKMRLFEKEVNTILEDVQGEWFTKQRYKFDYKFCKNYPIYYLDHYTGSGLFNKRCIATENPIDLVACIKKKVNVDLSEMFGLQPCML